MNRRGQTNHGTNCALFQNFVRCAKYSTVPVTPKQSNRRSIPVRGVQSIRFDWWRSQLTPCSNIPTNMMNWFAGKPDKKDQSRGDQIIELRLMAKTRWNCAKLCEWQTSLIRIIDLAFVHAIRLTSISSLSSNKIARYCFAFVIRSTWCHMTNNSEICKVVWYITSIIRFWTSTWRAILSCSR